MHFISFIANFKQILLIGGKQSGIESRVKWLWCVIDAPLFFLSDISLELACFLSFFLSFFLFLSSVLLLSCILCVCVDSFLNTKNGAESVGAGLVWCVCDFHFSSLCVSCIPTLLPDSLQAHYAYSLCNFTMKRLSSPSSFHLKAKPKDRKWLCSENLNKVFYFDPAQSWGGFHCSDMPYLPLRGQG